MSDSVRCLHYLDLWSTCPVFYNYPADVHVLLGHSNTYICPLFPPFFFLCFPFFSFPLLRWIEQMIPWFQHDIVKSIQVLCIGIKVLSSSFCYMLFRSGSLSDRGSTNGTKLNGVKVVHRFIQPLPFFRPDFVVKDNCNQPSLNSLCFRCHVCLDV